MDFRASVLLGGMLALQGCEKAATRTPAPVRVAAASDLTRAFEELGRDFTRATGEPVRFTFGSSGLLARQLRERAPFDVFAAADAVFVSETIASGVCDADTRAAYGLGRLALWTHAAQRAPARLEELLEPRFTRVAIAQPEHAPYGRAARQALIARGLWSRLEQRVVYAENVRQALQLAESKNVEVALVALSLVVGGDERRYLALDPQLHAPIDQTLVACSHGDNRQGGRKFAAYVNSSHGRSIMKRYGFVLPGECAERSP